MSDVHPLLTLLLGLLLGAGLMTLVVVWLLGTLEHRLSDEQIVALFRARGRRPAAEGRGRTVGATLAHPDRAA